ncbi:hypothetical protein BAE44_0005797 [Dichanthelium oligosanthes]|uniref:Ubiquitin-like protease family profile domain-containing protein n=1 Tax=Dichanthelium oligosanthes TaxID=888268 RepID=A0A1E5W6Z2_9POAL|nr:hypothetical protein BAE44_0005797 [Dichanthelium oligosanthes]
MALSRADHKSLEGQNFLLDGVISFMFAQMSWAFAQQDDDIVLVPPDLSLLLGYLQDLDEVAHHAAPLRLGSRRFDQVDGGTRWSLLVLHIAADSSSRFVHHDSLRWVNIPHSRRLADTLRQLLCGNPQLMECPIPSQELGSNDCGLYVLAVSQVICTSWRGRGHIGSSLF